MLLQYSQAYYRQSLENWTQNLVETRPSKVPGGCVTKDSFIWTYYNFAVLTCNK